MPNNNVPSAVRQIAHRFAKPTPMRRGSLSASQRWGRAWVLIYPFLKQPFGSSQAHVCGGSQ